MSPKLGVHATRKEGLPWTEVGEVRELERLGSEYSMGHVKSTENACEDTLQATEYTCAGEGPKGGMRPARKGENPTWSPQSPNIGGLEGKQKPGKETEKK